MRAGLVYSRQWGGSSEIKHNLIDLDLAGKINLPGLE